MKSGKKKILTEKQRMKLIRKRNKRLQGKIDGAAFLFSAAAIAVFFVKELKERDLLKLPKKES